MTGESAFSNQIRNAFNSDLLKSLDPTDPNQLPEIIIGTYIVNAAGLRQADELISNVAATRVQKSAAKLLAEIVANDILDKTAEIIGGTQLSVTTHLGSDSIRRKGFNAVDSVNGYIGRDRPSGDRRPFLRPPGGSLDTMRLYAADSSDYFDIRVLDDNYQPTVSIEVVDLPTKQNIASDNPEQAQLSGITDRNDKTQSSFKRWAHGLIDRIP